MKVAVDRGFSIVAGSGCPPPRAGSRGHKSADQILASVKRFCYKAQQTLCSEL